LSCWDLDGDGGRDAEEDVNHDSVLDALDCRGEQGEQGPAGAQGEQGEPGLDGNLALAGQLCDDDEYMRGFDSNGDIVCETVSYLESPLGLGKVSVTDNGIQIQSVHGEIVINATEISMTSVSGPVVKVTGSGVEIVGTTLKLDGSIVYVGGASCSLQAARRTDVVAGVVIATGSPTVFIC
jgi:hypothetical protein